MNRNKLFLFCLILAFSGMDSTAQLTNDSAAAEPQEDSGPLSPESPPALPAWLESAKKDYEEALKAQESDNLELAEKKLRNALKALSKAPKDAELLETKAEIEALLAKLEEKYTVPSTDEDPPSETPGLEVSEQELENAAPIGTPPSVEKKSYSIPMDAEDPLVKRYIAIYTGPRRKEMERALERMGLYKAMIEKRLKESGMPRELVYLPIVESEYYNGNVSRAGAVGIWQFMSDTARGFGLKVNFWVDERRDPEKATAAAIKYLKQLYEWFDDWHLALAGYNRGEYGVQRDMAFTRSPGFAVLTDRNILPAETEHYVPKFMACVLIADNAENYGFKAVEARPPRIDEVVLGKPIDLKVAAKCAGTTEEALKELNPTLRSWCTPKNDPKYALRLPEGSKDRFMEELAKVKDWTPGADVVRYRVKKGDVLGNIAKRYKTTVKAIQKDNKIKNPKHLRPGQVLVITPGQR